MRPRSAYVVKNLCLMSSAYDYMISRDDENKTFSVYADFF